MATLLPRGTDDLLLDAMVSILRAFSTQQAGLDASVAFSVYRDLLYAPDAETLKSQPMAVLSLDSLQPDNGKSGSRGQVQFIAGITVDLFAASAEQVDEAEDGGQKAVARLLYLKDQVMAGLFDMANWDFGLAPGSVQRESWSYQFRGVPGTDSEEYVVGGTLRLGIRFAFQALDRTLLDLETVAVTVAKDTGPAGDRWAGLYDLTGGA